MGGICIRAKPKCKNVKAQAFKAHDYEKPLGRVLMKRPAVAAILPILLLFCSGCSHVTQAVSVVCSSCVNIKKIRLTDENKHKLLAEIGNSKDISDQERHLLVEYSLRYSMPKILRGERPDLPTGKTLGELIDEERQWDAAHPEAVSARQESR